MTSQVHFFYKTLWPPFFFFLFNEVSVKNGFQIRSSESNFFFFFFSFSLSFFFISFFFFNFLLLFLKHLSAYFTSQHVRLSIKSSDKLYEIFNQLMFKLIIINLKLIKIHSNHFPFFSRPAGSLILTVSRAFIFFFFFYPTSCCHAK